jgi:hypothetical protein
VYSVTERARGGKVKRGRMGGWTKEGGVWFDAGLAMALAGTRDSILEIVL